MFMHSSIHSSNKVGSVSPVITTVLTLLLLVTGCNKTKNLTDSEKFKEEYESLNKKDNGEVNYINVKINKENPIVYITPKEVIDKMNKLLQQEQDAMTTKFHYDIVGLINALLDILKEVSE